MSHTLDPSSHTGSWTSLGNGLLDLVFPRICLACGSDHHGPLPHFCPLCTADLVDLETPRCPLCAHRVLEAGNWCSACWEEWPSFRGGCALGDYAGPLRIAVRAYKFEGRERLGRYLCDRLAERIRDRGFDPDVVIGVPRSRFKRWFGGFDPVRHMTRCLGAALDRPVVEGTCERHSGGRSQRHRDAIDRQVAIEHEFHHVPGAGLMGKDVLLVDDVMTTQATLRTIADLVLGSAGARRVRVAVLARSISPRRDP